MNAKKIKNVFAVLLFLYGAIAWAISGTGDTLFEHLHLELDAGNGMLSGIFAIFIWTTAHLKKEWRLRPYLAIAFAFAAGAEILHALIGVEWTGSFSWIGAASNTLRPATWPPSTYLFPVALGWILWTGKKEEPVSTPAFAAQLAVFAVLLYVVFINIPSYKAIGFLGIHRPFQIPVLVLLAGVGYAFWKKRAEDPLFEPLVYCITLLFISDSFMLYSTSPHEKWTMIAHTGKFAAYLLMHISMMELAMDDLIARNKAEKALLAESEKLQQSHKLLTDLSGQVPGVMYQFRLYPDGRSCFPFASQEISNIYEVSHEQVRENASAVFFTGHPDDNEGIIASIQESARTLQPWYHEYRVVLPKQGVRWRLGNARPQKLEDGSILWHGFITDITERKLAEEKVQHLAHYDALTDLPNRTLLADRLQQALTTARRDKVRLALMFLDLDMFKPINDTLGHNVGDLLLKEAAQRMQACVRESDTVARIGGDEFVVLLPTIEMEQDAMVVAEKIRHTLNQPFELAGHSLHISSSIGIAVYPEHGSEGKVLLKNADTAMYYAKESGRNTVKFFPTTKQEDDK